MEMREFKRWIAAAESAFPELMAKAPEDRLTLWYDVVFADLKFDDCVRWIRAVIAGDSVITFASQIPAICRAWTEEEQKRIAKPKRASYVYNPEAKSYRCLLCQDSGICLIWHPELISKISRGWNPDEVPWDDPKAQCAVQCTCEAAGPERKWTHRDSRLPVLHDHWWHVSVHQDDSRARVVYLGERVAELLEARAEREGAF